MTAAVWATYDEAAPTGRDLPDLDPGGDELVSGLTSAFAVRATIHQAIGMIIATQHSTPDRAYATLRLQAAEAEQSLLDAAQAVIKAE